MHRHCRRSKLLILYYDRYEIQCKLQRLARYRLTSEQQSHYSGAMYEWVPTIDRSIHPSPDRPCVAVPGKLVVSTSPSLGCVRGWVIVRLFVSFSGRTLSKLLNGTFLKKIYRKVALKIILILFLKINIVNIQLIMH